MTNTDSIATLAEALVGELTQAELTVTTAESCTGGWIAKSLTDVSGSSAVFAFGIVSYSNDAKESLLGVSSATLGAYGAVSDEVVAEMAAGALDRSGADLAVAVSGIAGPDGGTPDKPVGTVWFAWASRAIEGHELTTERRNFEGDRETIRSQSVVLALQHLREILRQRG
ncbi:MAG: CinA family protein [Woeseiaceae bacterium]